MRGEGRVFLVALGHLGSGAFSHSKSLGSCAAQQLPFTLPTQKEFTTLSAQVFW